MNETQARAAATLTILGPDPDAVEHLLTLKRALGGFCAIQGCDNDHRRYGFCDNHSKQHTRALANEAHTINRRRAS